MKFNMEPVKNWFGFSRRERRATFILIVIVFIIIGVRYFIPDSMIAIEDFSGTITPEEANTGFLRKDSSERSKKISTYTSGGTKFSRSAYVRKPVTQKKIRIDINSGDSATLVRLPGIGPVLSARIIKYRKLLGGFASTDQLKEVYGLPPETFEMIKERVFADSTLVIKININSATYKEISRLPYFEKSEVSAILKYRELKGRIRKIEDLTENKLITSEKARKVRPYLRYDE